VNRSASAVFLTLLALGACGGSGNPSSPQSPAPGSADVVQITGRERFGWNQAAETVANYHFAVYVDNARAELPTATCRPSTMPGMFDCESPLPPLTPGRHTLEVVAVVVAQGQSVEGPRAAALLVNVIGSGTASTADVAMSTSVAPTPPGSSTPARDGSGCGLAALPSMELAMWDETGTIRVTDMRSNASHDLTWKADPQWTIAALAAHPNFVENRQLYIAEMPAPRGALRLSRYREVGGVLGERAVLMQTALEARPDRIWMSFGVDGDLYIALLTSSAPAGNQSKNERFLIRVTDAGLPAKGNATGSLFAPFSAPRPAAMAWAPDSSIPWMLTRVSPDAYSVSQLGQHQAIEDHVYPSSAPIAMQIATIEKQQALFVTGLHGDVHRLGRDNGGWSVRDGFRLSDTTRPVRDALVLSTGEMAACGPVAGSGYGVWRARLP